MVTEFLLDTNVISEFARPHPEPRVLDRLASAERRSVIAATVWHELVFGVERLPPGARRDGLRAFVDEVARRFPVLPYDRPAASWHARERARLSSVGRGPAFADGQVAAVAVTNDLRLVTRNADDFVDFGDLVVENWFV